MPATTPSTRYQPLSTTRLSVSWAGPRNAAFVREARRVVARELREEHPSRSAQDVREDQGGRRARDAQEHRVDDELALARQWAHRPARRRADHDAAETKN